MFAGLTTLRKLCNHPDLVTNDYSQLITPSNHREGKRGGSTHQAKSSSAESAKATASPEAVNGDEDGDFVMIETAQRTDDEGTMGRMAVGFVLFFNSALFLEMTSLIRKYKPPSNLADT